MKEIKDAEELVAFFRGIIDVQYVYWAPGDFTRYRVTYVMMRPKVESANERTIEAFFITSGGKTLSVEKPISEWGEWTAMQWHIRFGTEFAGWWAGIRPILAAMAWTPRGGRNTAYTAQSAIEIGNVLGSH